MVLAFVLAGIIALANYLSGMFSIEGSEYKPSIISFVAGISVAYVFLHLLPGVYEGVNSFNRSLFVFVLIGFVVFHVVERFIYRFVGEGKISEDLKLNHSLWLLLYDFIIGIVLVQFFRIGNIEGFLFFVPVFFHAALSNLSLHKIHGFNFRKKPEVKNELVRIFLAGGSIYGAIVAILYNLSSKTTFILTGLVAGILLYIVIREMIPKYKEGNPFWFVVGVFVYSILIFLIWSI